jgi:hypothetical protein
LQVGFAIGTTIDASLFNLYADYLLCFSAFAAGVIMGTRIVRLVSGVALAVTAIAGTSLIANSANASSITVLNPSFEVPPPGGFPLPNTNCAPGCSYSEPGPIPDWTTVGDTGLFQPGNPLNTTYFNTLPDGPTVAYTNGGSVSQTVGTTTVAGDTYTLNVEVGFRKDVPDPGTVTLFIDGNPFVASGTPQQLSGNWSLYTAIGIATTTGGLITIDLSSPSAQGDWDSVTLSATPLPSTWTMLVVGFAGLAFFAYRGSTKGSSAIAAA